MKTRGENYMWNISLREIGQKKAFKEKIIYVDQHLECQSTHTYPHTLTKVNQYKCEARDNLTIQGQQIKEGLDFRVNRSSKPNAYKNSDKKRTRQIDIV